jgi:hypothetical protein
MNYQKPEMEILIFLDKSDVITMSAGEDTPNAGPSVNFGDTWPGI